jgi:predicted kinase
MIYLLIGLPGSGKSTWANQYAQNHENTIILNRDSLRTMIKGKYCFDLQYESFLKKMLDNMLKEALNYNYDIIIDETNLTIRRRLQIINIIHNYAKDMLIDHNLIPIKYIWFTENVNNLKNRMKDNRNYTEQKWNDVIESMKKIFEAPSPIEGYDQIIIINSNEDCHNVLL